MRRVAWKRDEVVTRRVAIKRDRAVTRRVSFQSFFIATLLVITPSFFIATLLVTAPVSFRCYFSRHCSCLFLFSRLIADHQNKNFRDHAHNLVRVDKQIKGTGYCTVDFLKWVQLKYGGSTILYSESAVIVMWKYVISTVRYGNFFWRLLYTQYIYIYLIQHFLFVFLFYMLNFFFFFFFIF